MSISKALQGVQERPNDRAIDALSRGEAQLVQRWPQIMQGGSWTDLGWWQVFGTPANATVRPASTLHGRSGSTRPC